MPLAPQVAMSPEGPPSCLFQKRTPFLADPSSASLSLPQASAPSPEELMEASTRTQQVSSRESHSSCQEKDIYSQTSYSIICSITWHEDIKTFSST